MQLRLPLSIALALLLQASAARAFTEPRTYFEDPAVGGGGGRFFTGSPAEGYGCAVCHTGPGRQWPLALKGLPEGGYEPGETYEIVLGFKELSEHAQARRDDGKVPPAMSIVAELVAENGVGAGKLEISPANEAKEGELCVIPMGQRATQLYRVRPGEQTREAGLSCEATGLGQRCVFTSLSCGASELRVRWTAPKHAQGPIWLSGGFVSAERAAGDPENDAVQEFDHILLPRGASEDFATATLQSGCSAAPGRSTSASWLASGLVLVIAALASRRRSARAVALAALALAACEETQTFDESDYDAHPNAGLFTPGNLIGADWDAIEAAKDAGTDATVVDSELENAINEASGEDRCVDREGEPGAKGELKIEFKSKTYKGFYEPENCGAVWIEDAEGKYVATPAIWAELRTRNLFVWGARRCKADRPDAVTSATLPDHSKPHVVTWDGKDRAGKIVPDGMYVLKIEVTEDEFNYGRLTEIPFERGSEAFTLEPEDTEATADLKLTYEPGP